MWRRPPDAVVGFGSQRIKRTSVSNGSGLSRGDRNRNARLARLRELVPHGNAIAGIDLADDTQAAVVTDHDSRVIARRQVRSRAWELGELLDWAAATAAGAGFASVTVACEPAGHRWRVLDQLAAGRGLALVCVQPLLVCRAREGEGLTRDKSGPKDAVLIARLASELRCYEPERASSVWARLRHLGARRSQVTTEATAAVITPPSSPHLLERGVQGFPQSVRALGYRAGQVLIKGDSDRQGKFVEPSPGSRREGYFVRPSIVHSPAARRAARSADICSAENTRPTRASASPSRRSRTRSVSDRTSMVSRSRSSSPDGTMSATWSPCAITEIDSPCSAWRTISAQEG
jgi:Transposase